MFIYDPIAAIDDPILDLIAAQQGLSQVGNPTSAVTQGAPPVPQPVGYPIMSGMPPPGQTQPGGMPPQPALMPQQPPPPAAGALSGPQYQTIPQPRGGGLLGALGVLGPSPGQLMQQQQAQALSDKNAMQRYQHDLMTRAAQGDRQAQQQVASMRALAAKPAQPPALKGDAALIDYAQRTPGGWDHLDRLFGLRAENKAPLVTVNPPGQTMRSIEDEMIREQHKGFLKEIPQIQEDLSLADTGLALLEEVWRTGGDTSGLDRLKMQFGQFLGRDDVGSTEEFEAYSSQRALNELSKQKGAKSDFEYRVAQSLGTGLDKTSWGNYINLRRWQFEKQKELAQAQAYPSWVTSPNGNAAGVGFNEWFNANNPRFERIDAGVIQGWKDDYLRARPDTGIKVLALEEAETDPEMQKYMK